MIESWKQCEGLVIADTFPLRQYLGGGTDHAVFLTEFSSPEPRNAAIKLVPGSADDNEKQLHHWSLASKLSHPHLLGILNMGRAQLGGTALAYLVMEYADESLAQVIPVRPLTADEARQMLDPAISALSHVHRQGFVHGHVKPANIMATGDCLKISSAGLSSAGEHVPVTQDAYTPPEGTRSQAGDVWSLGVTLVEALTQRLPLYDPTGSREPVLPDSLASPFLEIAQACLQRDPAARPALSNIAARMQPVKRPRLKWSYALAASVGLVLSAVLIAPRFLNQQGPSRQSDAVRAPSTPAVEQKPVEHKPAPQPDAAGAGRSEIIRQVLPDVPTKASRTIQGAVKVSVRVHVDPSGSVADAELNARGPSNYFAQLALKAARRWKFAPAGAQRAWILLFEFSRTGTHVVPVRAEP
jgi:TonB family protein